MPAATPDRLLCACRCVGAADGEKAIAKIRELGDPVGEYVGSQPYVGWQATFDPLLEEGARNYWKSHDLAELSDGAIGELLEAVQNLPGPECEIFIAHIGWAMSRVPGDATAYSVRGSHFIMNIHGRWREASQDAQCLSWVRHLFDRMSPHAVGTAYVNFMPEDDAERVEAAYGSNYHRSSAIKSTYGPENFSRMNQNVRPG